MCMILGVGDNNNHQNASEVFSGRSQKSLSIQKSLDDVIVYRPELVYYIRRAIVKRFFRWPSLEPSDVYCARHDPLRASAPVMIRRIGEHCAPESSFRLEYWSDSLAAIQISSTTRRDENSLNVGCSVMFV
jgi:hypothetical protein